ncbi:MAG: DUF2207 domain-containing protein [Sphingobacterium sp.]|nr:DUF2207 domain-containing protein [Sphingobacterium sp.]
MLSNGWLDLERKQKPDWLTAAGILMMFLSIVIGFVGLMSGGVSVSSNMDGLILFAALIGLPAGLFLLSIPVLIYAGVFSILTPERRTVRALEGFANISSRSARAGNLPSAPDYFEKYLAYAAVFGLGAGWAKYFQQLGGVPLLVWFHAHGWQ